jgi:hypothetical protein
MEREPWGPSGKDAGAAAQQRCVRLRGRSMAVIRGRDTCAQLTGRCTSAASPGVRTRAGRYHRRAQYRGQAECRRGEESYRRCGEAPHSFPAPGREQASRASPRDGQGLQWPIQATAYDPERGDELTPHAQQIQRRHRPGFRHHDAKRDRSRPEAVESLRQPAGRCDTCSPADIRGHAAYLEAFFTHESALERCPRTRANEAVIRSEDRHLRLNGRRSDRGRTPGCARRAPALRSQSPTRRGRGGTRVCQAVSGQRASAMEACC